jgi:hypothetical protein
MWKRLFLTATAGAAIALPGSAASAATDPYTNVPIFPGVTDRNPTNDQKVCAGGHRSYSALYEVPASVSADRLVAWYRKTFAGAVVTRVGSQGSTASVTRVMAADGASAAQIEAFGPKMTYLHVFRVNPPLGEHAPLNLNCADAQ